MCWSYCQPLFGCSVSVCASQAVCTCAILSACVVFMPLGCSVRVCAGSGVCLRSGCPVSVCSSLLAYVVVMLSASAMVVLSAMFCPPLLVLSCQRLCLSLCPFLVGLSYVLFFLSGAPGSPPPSLSRLSFYHFSISDTSQVQLLHIRFGLFSPAIVKRCYYCSTVL